MDRAEGLSMLKHARKANGRGVSLLLLAVTVLSAGCPIIAPWPAKVMVDRNRHLHYELAGLGPEDGIVVIATAASRDDGSRELEGDVISCIRGALAKDHPLVRIIAPDDYLRVALANFPWEEVMSEPVFQEHVSSLRLRYVIAVSVERGKRPREWGADGRGGGVWIGTWRDAWYGLSGLVADLSRGRTLGNVVARADGTTGFGFVGYYAPFLYWGGPVIFQGRVCRKFGREVAEFLANESPVEPGPSPEPTSLPPLSGSPEPGP